MALSQDARRTRATRIGERLGDIISTGVSIGTGYVWAKHGILTALAIWVGFVVIALAAYGAMHFPWSARRG